MKLNPQDKLAAGRLMAVERLPYFRAALTMMIPRRIEGLGTFAVTDRGVMLWDPAVVERWDISEVAGVIVHEAMHLLRQHSDRCAGMQAQPQLWNIAADLEINDDIPITGLALPGSGCFPENFEVEKGLAAEEYYRLLEKQVVEQVMAKLGEAGVGNGECGGCAGNPGKGEEGESKEGGEATGTAGRSDRELGRMRQQVAEDIRRETERGRGTVPGGWIRWSDQQLKPPQIPWRQKLARAVRGAVAYRPGAVDYHYTSPSRRQAGIGFGPGCPILPALRAPVPKIAVAVDTSGSMGEAELVEAISETRGVLDAAGANVTFLACDAEVHEVREVRTWREAVGLLKGGGGTDFRPIFEALSARHPRPDVAVVITDGCGPAPDTPPPYKVIWVLVGPYKAQPAEWGETIELDNEEEA